MMPRSIAKVNAKSIDGYFGVGTSCFFIRGTILSDTPVEGEYHSLSFMRAGNIIEIASLNSWCGPALIARNGCPKSVKLTTFTEPAGPLGDSLWSDVTWST